MMTKEQYNAQRTKLLNDMRAAIDAGDIETSNRCRDEINQLDADYEAAAQARANLAALENGNRSYNLPDVTPAQTNAAPQMVTINNFGAQTAHTDPSETNEYRTAFMNFVCRGTEIPADLRASVAPMLNVAATTTTTDASAVIPTTITREIIREMKSYGNLYAKIRKLNVQGGVEFPILTLKPTANWIGESKSSDDQKLTANTKVSFSYYGLECKIAQTLLASIVTFDEFQQMFVPLAVEAIVAAKEKAIIPVPAAGSSVASPRTAACPPRMLSFFPLMRSATIPHGTRRSSPRFPRRTARVSLSWRRARLTATLTAWSIRTASLLAA